MVVRLMQFSFEVWDYADKTCAPRFVELLETVFGSTAGNEAGFLWKHRDNPWSPSIITYAVNHADGRMAAIRAFWRWNLLYDGEPVTAYQPCDTAAHPDFRRMGLFTQLTELAIDEARGSGTSVLFNFPNPMSKPGYLKMGWHDVGGLITLVKPISPLKIGFRLVATYLGSDRRFVPDRGGKVSSEYNVCSERAWNWQDRVTWKNVLVGDRSTRMLDWRFCQHPTNRYEFIEHDDRLAVVRTGTRGLLREASIVDLFHQLGATAEDINDTVGLIAQHTEADIVTTVLTKGHPLQPVFRQLGFWPVKTRSNLVAYALADGLPSFEAKGWALSGCDIDTQ